MPVSEFDINNWLLFAPHSVMIGPNAVRGGSSRFGLCCVTSPCLLRPLSSSVHVQGRWAHFQFGPPRKMLPWSLPCLLWCPGVRFPAVRVFSNCGKIHVTMTILTISSVQFSDIKYLHLVVQPCTDPPSFLYNSFPRVPFTPWLPAPRSQPRAASTLGVSDF